MNKKGSFDWILFFVIVFAFVAISALITGAILSSNATTDRYERLCEKKDMEYFTQHVSGWNSDATVICLDSSGKQVEVELK